MQSIQICTESKKYIMSMEKSNGTTQTLKQTHVDMANRSLTKVPRHFNGGKMNYSTSSVETNYFGHIHSQIIIIINIALKLTPYTSNNLK